MSTLDLFGWTPPECRCGGNMSREHNETRGCPLHGAPGLARPAETIDDKFAAFDKAHPVVFSQLRVLALARVARGETFISIKALWEELRISLQRRDLAYDGWEPTYKLNNSYTALYARKLIAAEPSLADVIEIRRRKGER